MKIDEFKPLFNQCLTGTHRLEEITRASHGWDRSETVCRWCSVCGAVVVDLDYDNRTKPGMVRQPFVSRALIVRDLLKE